MNTQQVGTEIAGDVSFVIEGNALVPRYRFKAGVVRVSAGVFDVTVQRGDGVDGEHAEINVYHGAEIGGTAVDGLNYWVVERPTTAAGESVYRVFFTLPAVNAGGTAIEFVATDPEFASVTIRRKIPSVN
jgi:hypothetical protein